MSRSDERTAHLVHARLSSSVDTLSLVCILVENKKVVGEPHLFKTWKDEEREKERKREADGLKLLFSAETLRASLVA